MCYFASLSDFFSREPYPDTASSLPNGDENPTLDLYLPPYPTNEFGQPLMMPQHPQMSSQDTLDSLLSPPDLGYFGSSADVRVQRFTC